MYPLELCGGGLYLGILSVYDIKTRKIPGWLFYVGMGGVILLKCLYKNISLLQAGIGIGIGVIFCIISKVTEETFGMGDSYLITILGGLVGAWNLLYILAYAFLFSASYSIILLVRKRFRRNLQIPFVPFILFAYILWVV